VYTQTRVKVTAAATMKIAPTVNIKVHTATVSKYSLRRSREDLLILLFKCALLKNYAAVISTKIP
jgi:hypothetical protein